MEIPLGNGDPKTTRQFEIAAYTNGSLEAAGRRATLFSRLLDESEAPLTETISSGARGG